MNNEQAKQFMRNALVVAGLAVAAFLTYKFVFLDDKKKVEEAVDKSKATVTA